MVDGFVLAYKYRQFIRKVYTNVVYLLVMLVLISIQRIHTTNNTDGTSVAIQNCLGNIWFDCLRFRSIVISAPSAVFVISTMACVAPRSAFNNIM